MMSSSQKIAVGSCVEQGQADVAGVVDPDRGEGARLRVGVEPRLAEDALAGGLAQVEGGRVEGGREVADAPVAEVEQVLDRGGRPALGVEADRGAAGRLGLHHHDVGVAPERVRRGHLEQQVAVDGTRAQGLERLLLPAPVVRGVDQRDRVAGLLRGALGAAQDAAEERVGDVGDQQRDRARAAQPQGLGGDVGAVAELAGAAAHALLRLLGDAALALAREDERDGRLRHAGAPSDVDARHAVWGGALDGRNATTRGERGLTGSARHTYYAHTYDWNSDRQSQRSSRAAPSPSAAPWPAVRAIPRPHTALVVDAASGRDGRQLLDARLRDADAVVRLPRSSAEALTDVRYLAAQGYRVVVTGPQASAAARAAGVDAVSAATLESAVAAAR